MALKKKSLQSMRKLHITAYEQVSSEGISPGKFSDPFRVMAGYNDAKKLMKEIQPAVVFSKGGFVSVPVAAAAHHYKIPVIAHESDLTPGLANKISARYATKICTTFPDTVKDLPKGLGVYTGLTSTARAFPGKCCACARAVRF